MKISSTKCKFDAKFIFLELTNFDLKQILNFLFSMEIVPSLDKGRYHFGGKQKLQNLLQIKVRELQKNKFRIKFALFRWNCHLSPMSICIYHKNIICRFHYKSICLFYHVKYQNFTIFLIIAESIISVFVS